MREKHSILQYVKMAIGRKYLFSSLNLWRIGFHSDAFCLRRFGWLYLQTIRRGHIFRVKTICIRFYLSPVPPPRRGPNKLVLEKSCDSTSTAKLRARLENDRLPELSNSLFMSNMHSEFHGVSVTTSPKNLQSRKKKKKLTWLLYSVNQSSNFSSSCGYFGV